MNFDLITNKKLLIMGGGSQHCKVVEAAKELGVITYVVDNLETAPAKEIADYAYQINVTETDQLVDLCKRVGIDGIISGWFDFVQPHYQRLCERMGMPCYGTKEQFDALTRKKIFKENCIAYGVGTPRRLDSEQIKDPLPFDVIVKPSNSRGSRGARICTTKHEVEEAVEAAISASYDGDYVIEQYVDARDAFCVTYLFVNGEAYLEQLSDAYFGEKEHGLDKVAVAYRSPSIRADEYVKKEGGKFVRMLKGLGIKNGPIVAQGFFAENDVLFFDPGRRFAGGEYERAFKRLTGIDVVKAMVIFALTGEFPSESIIAKDSYLLNGKTTIRLQINVRAGLIVDERGFDSIQQMPEVEYVARYHAPGDIIEATGNTHQRYAHIIVVADDTNKLRRAILEIYGKIGVFDERGSNMIVSIFDPDKLRGVFLTNYIIVATSFCWGCAA